MSWSPKAALLERMEQGPITFVAALGVTRLADRELDRLLQRLKHEGAIRFVNRKVGWELVR